MGNVNRLQMAATTGVLNSHCVCIRSCLPGKSLTTSGQKRMNLAAAIGAASMSGVGSKGRFSRVQLKDGGLGGLRRREASRGQHIFELLAGPSCTDALFRLPDADDV